MKKSNSELKLISTHADYLSIYPLISPKFYEDLYL
jgi:hypothetical protein